MRGLHSAGTARNSRAALPPIARKMSAWLTVSFIDHQTASRPFYLRIGDLLVADWSRLVR